MDRADPRAGEHGERRLRDHRQIDGDPVALLRPGRLQHIGEAADLRVKLAIADPPRFRLGVIRLPDDGNVVAPAFQMPVKAVGADVQHPVLEPFYAEVRLVEGPRSEEHTSELQSLMRISYAVSCLKKKTQNKYIE